MSDAKAAVKLNPKSAKSYCVLAEFLLADANFDDALVALDKAADLEPGYDLTYHHRASVWVAYDPSRCLKNVEKYLELRPSIDGDRAKLAYYWKGYSLSLLNRHREALRCFEVLHKLAPTDLRNVGELTLVYLDLGKSHVAAHYAEECVRLAPDRPRGYTYAAEAYAKIGRMKEARSMVEKVVALSAKDKSFLCSLGDVHVAIGEYAVACSYYNKAIARSPGHFLATVKKASLLATCPDPKIRDGKKAMALAESALISKDTFEWFRWRPMMALAEANAECGDFDKAVDYARLAIDRAGPEFGRRSEFQEKLSCFQKKKSYRINRPSE
jgi:tetratricopeptide (TPR) repeat protein